jgi:autotransporter-associated beta strand protein
MAPLFGLILAAQPAAAQNGTWSRAAGGTYNWSDPTNWAGGVAADGAGNTASFTTANLTGDVTVMLDGDRTIGNLTFDNPTNTFGWTLAGTSVLTLAGATPTIAVNNANITATINVSLAGAAGLTTSGPGTLVLTGNNTFSGGLNVTAGTVVVAPTGSNNPLGTDAVTLGPGATLSFRTPTPAATTFANALTVPGAASPNVHFVTWASALNVTMGALTIGNQGVLVIGPAPSAPANQGCNLTFGATTITVATIDAGNNGSGFGRVTLGPVSGVGPFSVEDNGIVVLTGPGTYTVGTNLLAGRLIVTNTTGSATGSSQLNVDHATLGGTGTAGGNVVLFSGGVIAPGDPASVVPNSGFMVVCP